MQTTKVRCVYSPLGHRFVDDPTPKTVATIDWDRLYKIGERVNQSDGVTGPECPSRRWCSVRRQSMKPVAGSAAPREHTTVKPTRSGPRERARNWSIWLMPSGPVYEELADIISGLSQQFLTPRFKPHVTLLGGVRTTEPEVLSGTRQLAGSVQPHPLILGELDVRDRYLECLFARVIETDILLGAHARAKAVMGIGGPRNYRPHLSLMYGHVASSVKRQVIGRLGRELHRSFEVDCLHVFSTEGPPEEWFKLATFDLRGPDLARRVQP